MKAWLSLAIVALALSAQTGPRNLTLEPIRVQRKLALVIGNQAYLKSPLINPVNDSTEMAKALRSLGFDEVVEKTDLSNRQMRVEIDRFSASLHSGDLALFYYAGHGAQANEQNYLIPVDFAGSSEADLPYDAYPAGQVRDKLEESGARLRILILDACRNNPFRAKRDGVKGLSPMGSSVEGTFIAYATADNGVADDNPKERNGLFTKLLLAALRTPGLDLKRIFEKAKQDVFVESKKLQRPFTYDGMIGQFYFTAEQEETAFWNGVDKSDSESLQAYLSRYGDGQFAETARRYLTRMASSAEDGTASLSTGNGAGVTELKPGTVKLIPKGGLRYVWIPAGTFQMGCSRDDDCDSNERPAHEVRIPKGFWMGETEVTQESYQRVMGKNPSRFKGLKLPVEQVTWNEARRYCRAVDMRLPTEAEWEYAARAGGTASRYGDLDAIAWHHGNSQRKTHEVAGKLPNSWGLYDMLGNLVELVADWFGPYSKASATDPQGPANGKWRVLRGGNWASDARFARASYRGRFESVNDGSFVGFRCAGN